MKQQRAQQKLVAQLVGQVRWLERERCSWELVRFVRTARGGLVDVERHASDDADLFGLLATMIVWRDHVHLPAGRVDLRWYQGKRSARVAVRMRVGGRVANAPKQTSDQSPPNRKTTTVQCDGFECSNVVVPIGDGPWFCEACAQ